MATTTTFFHLLLLLSLFFLSTKAFSVIGRRNVVSSTEKLATAASAAEERQTYIVHVRRPDSVLFDASEDRVSWYKSFLPASAQQDFRATTDHWVYSYENVLTGFAARLTPGEVREMSKKVGFLHATPDRRVPLQTTHTPAFLGLNPSNGFVKGSDFGSGVIVGVLDTGVTPNHPSFDGAGMPPPPAKWKGRCDFGAGACNNKLIGARTFLNGSTEAPVDEEGHGTHTASTAAGRVVPQAEVLGNAKGTAVGMAPYAHLAVYKVCGPEDCATSDILAAMDTAVADGVDVLSLSIGGSSVPFFDDGIAIGAFGAIEKGVFVSCAAANSGPGPSTLSNEAPWILTVAASTMDRSIRSTVKLGNGVELHGESLFQPSNFTGAVPLVYAGANTKKPDTMFCGNGSLDGMDVVGKIVVCSRGNGIGRIDKGTFVMAAGGAGMILMNQETDGFSTLADPHVLPASHVAFADGATILAYINSSSAPTASLVFEGTVLGTSPAPAITSFSSRGPSLASPNILKPDITGPGVSVLAAWPFPVGPAADAGAGVGASASASAAAAFNVISGTSMSTPHLSGIAALLKGVHPDWSPAAIKSALMTTSYVYDRSGKPIVDETLEPASLFATGAGHVNPMRAVEPGLVYDLEAVDYVPYLCGIGYSTAQVQAITRSAVSCSSVRAIRESDLNYPSIAVTLGEGEAATVTRTVTNVGAANTTYVVDTTVVPMVSVNVVPKVLQFGAIGEKMSYTVTFRCTGGGVGTWSQGHLYWLGGKYTVRTPISVRFSK